MKEQAGIAFIVFACVMIVLAIVFNHTDAVALRPHAVYNPTLDPTAVLANTTAEQTYTISGLQTSDTIVVNKPTMTTGCGIVGARVSATDTLALTWGNFTGSSCDPASETYRVVAIK